MVKRIYNKEILNLILSCGNSELILILFLCLKIRPMRFMKEWCYFFIVQLKFKRKLKTLNVEFPMIFFY